MITRIAALVLTATVVAALTAALVGCGASPGDKSPSPATSQVPGDAPAGGMKIAPGLYDLDDGTVQAVGTAEYRNLEGGFWAIIGGTEAEGDVGKIVAVIANGEDFSQQLEELSGLSVIVKGTRMEGASTRMAGPEIMATEVVATSDTPPGPAE